MPAPSWLAKRQVYACTKTPVLTECSMGYQSTLAPIGFHMGQLSPLRLSREPIHPLSKGQSNDPRKLLRMALLTCGYTQLDQSLNRCLSEGIHSYRVRRALSLDRLPIYSTK